MEWEPLGRDVVDKGRPGGGYHTQSSRQAVIETWTGAVGWAGVEAMVTGWWEGREVLRRSSPGVRLTV